MLTLFQIVSLFIQTVGMYYIFPILIIVLAAGVPSYLLARLANRRFKTRYYDADAASVAIFVISFIVIAALELYILCSSIQIE